MFNPFFISSFSDKHKSNINIFDYSFFIFAIHLFLLECVQYQIDTFRMGSSHRLYFKSNDYNLYMCCYWKTYSKNVISTL